MVWFLLSVATIAIGVVALVVATKLKNPESNYDVPKKTVTNIVAGVALVVGLLILASSSFTQIDAKNVGIVVSVGKPENTLDNGFHLVKPWADVVEIDGTVQNINRDKAKGAECVTVRLKNQTIACVDVTLQWNLNREDANQLWQSYRSNGDFLENIKKNVIERELQSALNRELESADPLSTIQSGGAPIKAVDVQAHVKEYMIAHLPKGLSVDAVLVPVIHYDDVTQSKLNAFAQAIADTQVAIQQQKTNEAIALANQALAQASSNDPGVKYANCLAFLKDLAAKGQLQNLQYGGFACSPADGSVIVGK